MTEGTKVQTHIPHQPTRVGYGEQHPFSRGRPIRTQRGSDPQLLRQRYPSIRSITLIGDQLGDQRRPTYLEPDSGAMGMAKGAPSP